VTKPLYPWVGGKTRVLDYINANTPSMFGDYHEPFLGGGAVAIQMMEKYPKKTFHLSDFNSELVLAWQAVKNSPHEVIELLKEHFDRHEKTYFLSVRGWDKRGLLPFKTDAERGARFIYICVSSFRSVWSENDAGHCTSSFGFEVARNYDFGNLLEVSALLNSRNTVITHRSYEEGLPQVEASDFVYLDPPYATDDDEGTATFDEYLKGGAGEGFQEKLRVYLDTLSEKGVAVLASNANTATTRALYDGWGTAKKKIVYGLALNQGAPKDEMLFANPTLFHML